MDVGVNADFEDAEDYALESTFMGTISWPWVVLFFLCGIFVVLMLGNKGNHCTAGMACVQSSTQQPSYVQSSLDYMWSMVPYSDIISAYVTLNFAQRTRSQQLQSWCDILGMPFQVLNATDNQVAMQFVVSSFVAMCGIKITHKKNGTRHILT